jgi:hypothetical protein
MDDQCDANDNDLIVGGDILDDYNNSQLWKKRGEKKILII